MLRLGPLRMPSLLWRIFQACLLILVCFFVYLNISGYISKTPLSLSDDIISSVPFSWSKGAPKEDLHGGNTTLLDLAPSYIKAIMDPEDKQFNRMACPRPSHMRYDYMRSRSRNNMDKTHRKKYFFALNLHQSAPLLPRLLGSIIEAIRFLGPAQCALSIVEGRSTDGTYEILKLLEKEVGKEQLQYFFQTSDVDPKVPGGDRIKMLADLRNQALAPMVDNPTHYVNDTTVIFLNDVAICMEDILELIHQRAHLNADMVCGMDWANLWKDPTFYDVWVARDMKGQSFFEIGEDGNWNSAWNLFWDNPDSKQRFDDHKPIQVFSCWNGGTAFVATPLLQKKVKFRAPKEEECYQGEPSLFCKDMWHLGWGKIAVLPTVNLEYSDDGGTKIKELRGYVSGFGNQDNENIQWEPNPPTEVRCIVDYAKQTMRPWDEGLT